MSSDVSEARARAHAREVERERARQKRKEEAAQRRSGRNHSGGEEEDPKDPMTAAGWDRKADRERQAEKRASGEVAGSGVFAPTSYPPNKEDQVLAHAAHLQKENAATLKHTIKVARETTQVGAATIHKLNEQTEQFQRMDNTLDETQDSLTRSERILRGMKSFGGAFANMFSSGKSKKKHSGEAPSLAPETTSTTTLDEKDRQRLAKREMEEARGKHLDLEEYATRRSPEAYSSSPNGASASAAAAASARPVVAPNARQAEAMQVFAANQKEEDAALEELSDVLGALKEQSQIMSQQLQVQNKMLDSIETKVDNTSTRLQKGTKTMGKIT